MNPTVIIMMSFGGILFMISVLIAHLTSEIIREREGGQKRKEGLAERRASIKKCV